jgi:hypothetical protein
MGVNDPTGLAGAEPVDDFDAMATLLGIYALWTAPLPALDGRERLQNHSEVAALKWRLEEAFLATLDGWLVDQRVGPADTVEALRRIARGPGGDVYDWLATSADWPQLVTFLAIEGGPDGGFDDLVALCQVGISGPAKVVLGENYWDEMGRGDPAAVHTVLHDRLVAAVELPQLTPQELPLSALRRSALNGLLGTNRWLQPEMLGALGLLELQAGPRCRKVLRALERLGAPADAFPFYEEHAVTDPMHGKAWLDGAVKPLVAENPAWGPRIVRGALWRAEANRRLFDEVHTLLEARELLSA